jgi:ribosomal protein S16
MLAIRLARQWKNKKPSYRVVLTEHTKPVKAWYQLILWRYNPMDDKWEYDLPAIKSWIEKWAKPSERLAKVLFATTKDSIFQKYIVHRTRTAKPKKEEKK